MAWTCTGATNLELIKNLRSASLISNTRVFEALCKTDRRNYAPGFPYEDSPQRIGFDATISAPHMHAHALELLEPFMRPGAKVLDVGCGSGYLLTAMSHMLGEEGKVFGIDYLQGLVDLTVDNISKTDSNLLDSGRVVVALGDGWKGIPDEAPFDCIHVGAAAASIPDALVRQLKDGGRMIIPGTVHVVVTLTASFRDNICF
jgi:protein-L-isoaspartate(D-aspartate) O-methyltransferase